MLTIDESSVGTEAVESGPIDGFTFSQVMNRVFDVITDNGVLGNPNQSNSNAGDVILGKLAGSLIERIDREIGLLESTRQ